MFEAIKPRDLAVVKMRDEGSSFMAIGKQFGISHQRAKQIYDYVIYISSFKNSYPVLFGALIYGADRLRTTHRTFMQVIYALDHSGIARDISDNDEDMSLMLGRFMLCKGIGEKSIQLYEKAAEIYDIMTYDDMICRASCSVSERI